MNKRIFILIGAVATLAACGGDDPVSEQANNFTAADVDVLPPDESAAAGGGGAAPAAPEPSDSTIPTALQGRWGMVPADCDEGRSDAKGLLVVSAGELRFYESVARPESDVETSSDSIKGNFAFTGEGQQWTRFQSLELQEGNLVRTQSEPMASYTYVRCG